MAKRLKMDCLLGAFSSVFIRGMLVTENGYPASSYILWALERLSRERYRLRYVHQETGKTTMSFILGRAAALAFLRGERKRRQEMNHARAPEDSSL